jgi:hypothetical protein
VVFKTTAIDHSAIPPRRNCAKIRAPPMGLANESALCHRKCHQRWYSDQTLEAIVSPSPANRAAPFDDRMLVPNLFIVTRS